MAANSTISTDLTKGNVSRQLLGYAAPLVVSGILQALYSMVDIIVVGHFVGGSAISAINNAGLITVIVTNTAIGLTTGGNILMSQYFGAKDDGNRKEAAGTLFSSALLIGLAAMAILNALGMPLLSALDAPSLEEASAYLRICAFGMVPILCYNALSAVLRAVGDSKRPFRFIAVATVVNVFLDLLFVGGFGMGVEGAAIATVIAQAGSFVLSLLYTCKQKTIMTFSANMLRIRKKHLALILKLGIPSMLQMTIGGLSWLTVAYLINGYGVVASAGNGISIKIKDFFQLFITTMAGAAATMIAQNLGARQYGRTKEIAYTTMKITVGISVALIVLTELFAPALAGLFTSDPAVIAAAVTNLRIEIISQLFYAIFLVYNALAIGAGNAMFAMLNSLVNCIGVRVVLSILFNHLFGLNGIYLACMIAPGISVPIGWLYMRSNKWRRSLVTELG